VKNSRVTDLGRLREPKRTVGGNGQSDFVLEPTSALYLPNLGPLPNRFGVVFIDESVLSIKDALPILSKQPLKNVLVSHHPIR
jgi:hypothetical protein